MADNLSVRMKKEKLKELDEIAKLIGVDRATIVRNLIDYGIHMKRIDIAIELYQKGETLEKAANLTKSSIWDLIDEIKKRGITSKFDIEQEKSTILNIFGKENKELAEKIKKLNNI
jgi:predicted HTH domain antitoxin